MNEQARAKVTKARTRLILRHPFFGYLALHLEPRQSDNLPVPTMGTDGEYLYYDAGYVLKVDIDELQGVICHEVFHCAFGHLWRKGAREDLRWNIAADAVTNEHVLIQGLSLPKGVIRFPAAEHMSVEEMYNKIKVKEVEGSVLDDHKKWGEKKKSDAGKSKGKGEQEGGLGGNGKGELLKRSLEGKWKERASQARQLAKQRGIGMGGLEEELDELFDPKLPWRELLRHFVMATTKSNYRLLPPNKRHLWRGLYLPSIYGEQIELAFAVDTSGSMSTEDIKEGLSEVKGICDQYEDYVLHLYQCDYGVQEYKELTPFNFDFPRKIKGRGGTAFEPVFKDIQEKNIEIVCLVYFTDLMGSFPKTPPTYPVIWLSTHGGKVPFGELIQYDRER